MKNNRWRLNEGRSSGTGRWKTKSCSENVRLGQARAQGKEIGRPREVSNDLGQRILTLRANGYGYKTISQATGVPRSTVRRILKGAKNIAEIQRVNPAVSVSADAGL
jgi:DNA invertase Pin-like site-specific DNA recombinase